MDHLREFEEFDASEFDDLFALGFEDIWDHCVMEFYMDELTLYDYDGKGSLNRDFFKSEVPNDLIDFAKDVAESNAHTVMEKKQVKHYTNGVRIIPENIIFTVKVGYKKRDVVDELKNLKPSDRHSGKLGSVANAIVIDSDVVEERITKIFLNPLWKKPDGEIKHFGTTSLSSSNPERRIQQCFWSASKLYGKFPLDFFVNNEIAPKRVTFKFYSQSGEELKKWNSFY